MDADRGACFHVSTAEKLLLTQRAREFRRNSTASEDRLWQALRNRQVGDVKFRRQQVVGPFIVDFFCSSHRLIIEVDGPVHDHQVDRDRERDLLLETSGYRVVHVLNSQVDDDLPAVLHTITALLSHDATPPHLPSPLGGEGQG